MLGETVIQMLPEAELGKGHILRIPTSHKKKLDQRPRPKVSQCVQCEGRQAESKRLQRAAQFPHLGPRHPGTWRRPAHHVAS